MRRTIATNGAAVIVADRDDGGVGVLVAPGNVMTVGMVDGFLAQSDFRPTDRPAPDLPPSILGEIAALKADVAGRLPR